MLIKQLYEDLKHLKKSNLLILNMTQKIIFQNNEVKNICYNLIISIINV